MKIGFIGAGNMASAIIMGIINAGLVPSTNIIASAHTRKTIDNIKETYKVCVTLDNRKVAENSDVLFLAVKPKYYKEVISEIVDVCDENKIIVSIAPGHTLSDLKDMFFEDAKIIRTMPNTPALVGEGMTSYCPNENMTEQDVKIVTGILSSFGDCGVVTEDLMDAAMGLAGCSPAFVYMFIEALADAGVREGMPRASAYKFAAQAVLGSAKMVLETGIHPGELKDKVCSPAGVTIAGVADLERTGFRNSVISAVDACMKKAKSM